MFHIVDFKGGRKRMVVPDTWLSINDTLCLLPHNVTDSDLEVLARNRVEPGDGWMMFGVKSLETFETYADAVKQLGKSKEAPQSQADPQRKRKKPSYLADYDVLDAGGGGDETSYTVFSTADNEEDASENEWETPPAPQVLPRVVQFSSCNKRRIVQFNRSRPPEQKQTVEVKCACQSSCHITILQALQSMQKQLDRTNQMVEQLLTGRPKPMNQKSNHRWTPNYYKPRPQKVPWNPTNRTNGQDEMEDVSQDDTNFVQCVYQNQDTPAAQKSTETPKSTETLTTSSAAAEDTFLTTSLIPYQPPTAQGNVLENINVRKWLMLNPKGRELMHKLDSEIFFPRDRQLLVRILCKKLVEYCGNAYPTAIMKEKLAKEIVKDFPFLKSTRGEGHEAFYDIKTGQGFIGFRLKTYRKSFPVGERRHHLTNRKKMTEGMVEVPATVKEELLSPSDLEENVTLMTQRDPDEENKILIVAKLKETMKNRQKEIKETDMTVAEIFSRYPRLKDYKGEMITMEFAELYSNGEKFLQQFESYFAPRILSYVTLQKPHLLYHVSNCEDNLKSLLLLPELLPQPNYKRSNQTANKGSKHFHPVLGTNVRKLPNPDLIAFVNSEENLDEVMAESDRSLQPYLICVNPPQKNGKKKFFIRVDEILIEGPDDPMSAFDVLFKVHYVFNIQYAKSLDNFYNFVSSLIYELDEPRSSSDAFFTLLRNIPVFVEEMDPS